MLFFRHHISVYRNSGQTEEEILFFRRHLGVRRSNGQTEDEMLFCRRHLSVCHNSGHNIHGILEIKSFYLGNYFFSDLKLKQMGPQEV
jgi:hypothetical protein